jgi:hypothetical protein
MAIKFSDRCQSCSIIKEEAGSKLAERAPKSRLYKLYEDYHFKKITQGAITEAYPVLSIIAVSNHANKHQHPSAAKLRANFKNKTVLDQLQAHRERELQVAKKRNHMSDRDEMATIAMEALRNGDMKLSASVLAKILKDEADIEAKKQDQNIDILRIMTSSRSGELELLTTNKDFNPWVDVIDSEILE